MLRGFGVPKPLNAKEGGKTMDDIKEISYQEMLEYLKQQVEEKDQAKVAEEGEKHG